MAVLTKNSQFLHNIESLREMKRYRREAYILQDFDLAERVYFVKEGIIKVIKTNASGKKIVIDLIKEGDCFGLETLFLPKDALYGFSLLTLTKVTVESVPRAEMEKVILRSPELTQKVIQQLSNQVMNCTTLLKDYTLNDVYGKTVKAIQRLGSEYGYPSKECEVVIDLPMTIQELSNLIGSSRETVSRAVTKLRDRNFISIDHKRIKINDWSNFCLLAEAY